jgi:hypothetical protein
MLPVLLKLPVLVLALGPMAGCAGTSGTIASVTTPIMGSFEIAAAATVLSVATIQRTPADAVYSVLAGRDCSVVRLDQGKTYCRAVEPAPDPPAYCTRSLGVVDCWREPAAVLNVGPEMADGPRALTAPQEEHRTRGWPNL